VDLINVHVYQVMQSSVDAVDAGLSVVGSLPLEARSSRHQVNFNLSYLCYSVSRQTMVDQSC